MFMPNMYTSNVIIEVEGVKINTGYTVEEWESLSQKERDEFISAVKGENKHD